ncbi:unnamed protein product, partial [Sphacelaria rigidula]
MAPSAPDGVPRPTPSKRPKASPIRPKRCGRHILSLELEPAAPRGMIAAISSKEGVRNVFAIFEETYIMAPRTPCSSPGVNDCAGGLPVRSHHLRDAASCQSCPRSRTSYVRRCSTSA